LSSLTENPDFVKVGCISTSQGRIMERLWAPWRREYILGTRKTKGCIFCQKAKENKDEKNYVLFRGKDCLVMLNLFPYNNGHLMVAPYRHVKSVENLTEGEAKEMMKILCQMASLLKEVLHPEGFNVGMNLGKVAGAGVVDHVHLHIVPRWKGDSHFMSVLSDTRVISEALKETYNQLKAKLPRVRIKKWI